MPKIKVKNIPAATRERVCDKMYLCSECPFHLEERFVIDEDTDIGCIVDTRYDPEEKIIDLTEDDFPTNREWLESLSNFELAALMTSGYTVKDGKLKGLKTTTNLMTDINEVTEWLSRPCSYLMEEE